MFRHFLPLCRSRKSRSRTRYSISSVFREKQRPSLDCRAVQCYSILKTVPTILASPADILRGASSTPKNVCGGGYRDSRFENAQARRICELQDQPFLEYIIAWHLRTNVQCFREVSMIIFLDILDNWLSESRRWSVESIPDFTKCPRSTTESTSNQGQCLKSLEIFKETFHVFRGIQSKNWNKFKTAMYLPLSRFPATWSVITATKHSVLRFLSGFLAFI